MTKIVAYNPYNNIAAIDSSDPSTDIAKLIQALIAMNTPGNQGYAISQIEITIAQLQKDLPQGNFSQDQMGYINQAIQDANSVIDTYESTGNVDMSKLLSAMSEFMTPEISGSSSNNPTQLAAIQASYLICLTQEMQEGIMDGFHPTAEQIAEMQGPIQDAMNLLQKLSGGLPSNVQAMIAQLSADIQNKAPAKDIAVLANQIFSALAYPSKNPS